MFLSKISFTYCLSLFLFFLRAFFCLHALSLNINQTQDELGKVAREISELHETLRVKDNALKLAETRLENRTNRFELNLTRFHISDIFYCRCRSGMELVLDSVYDGLVDEVVSLREIRKVLKERIVNAKGMHNNLEEQIAKLDKDLQHKEHTLATDVKGLDMRMRIKENAWNTANNRAIEFNNVDHQISRF